MPKMTTSNGEQCTSLRILNSLVEVLTCLLRMLNSASTLLSRLQCTGGPRTCFCVCRPLSHPLPKEAQEYRLNGNEVLRLTS